MEKTAKQRWLKSLTKKNGLKLIPLTIHFLSMRFVLLLMHWCRAGTR